MPLTGHRSKPPPRSSPCCNVQSGRVVPNAAAWEAVAMGKQRVKPNYRRRVHRLPDLDHCKLAVLNSLGSPASRRVYEYAIDQFMAWYCSEPRLAFNRIVVVRYRMHPGIKRAGCKHHQPATRSRAPPRSRGCRLRLAKSRVGCRHQPSKRSEAARVSFRLLAQYRSKLDGLETSVRQ